MADVIRNQGKIAITVEPRALQDLISTLRLLDKETSQEVRDKAQPMSKKLAQALTVAAAFSAAPPQAILVARSISTPRDRLIRVDVGGSKKVGRPYGGQRNERGRVTGRQSAPAGALLWGSEHGSRGGVDRAGRNQGKRFVKPYNKDGYWINPTIDANIQDVANEYTDMLKAIVRRLKLEGGE
jgi:hypothetical protein